MTAKNLLSIQSHVVYGHVGNAAAAFVLERKGITVWRLNTVQFSNHLGYETFEGEVFDPAVLRGILNALEERGALADCAAVLSGYIGSKALGDVVEEAVTRVKAANPEALYACDPVMGDVGKGVYVDPAIPPFMSNAALPLADIITPNHFELEQLIGRALPTIDQILQAARTLLVRGPEAVLVTSVTASCPPDSVSMLAVTQEAAWRVVTPYLPLDPMPNGAGDSVAALFLGEVLNGASPAQALSHAASAIFAVLEATGKAGTRELQLIPAQELLVKPPRQFAAQEI